METEIIYSFYDEGSEYVLAKVMDKYVIGSYYTAPDGYNDTIVVLIEHINEEITKDTAREYLFRLRLHL
jgi:hypothetical protein